MLNSTCTGIFKELKIEKAHYYETTQGYLAAVEQTSWDRDLDPTCEGHKALGNGMRWKHSFFGTDF